MSRLKKQKSVDIWGYKLPINVQNFMQKDSAQAKISLKVVGGYFFTHPVYIIVQVLRVDQIGQVSPVRKTSAICSMLLSLEPRSDFRCPHSCTRCLVNTARGSIVSCRRVLYRKIGRRWFAAFLGRHSKQRRLSRCAVANSLWFVWHTLYPIWLSYH